MSPTGQILLPTYEVPVFFLAGSVRGELDSVCGVLLLHRVVSWARVQKLNSEYFIYYIHPSRPCPKKKCVNTFIVLILQPTQYFHCVYSVTNTERESLTAPPAAACVRKTLCTWESASPPSPTARSVLSESDSQIVNNLALSHTLL